MCRSFCFILMWCHKFLLCFYLTTDNTVFIFLYQYIRRYFAQIMLYINQRLGIHSNVTERVFVHMIMPSYPSISQWLGRCISGISLVQAFEREFRSPGPTNNSNSKKQLTTCISETSARGAETERMLGLLSPLVHFHHRVPGSVSLYWKIRWRVVEDITITFSFPP